MCCFTSSNSDNICIILLNIKPLLFYVSTLEGKQSRLQSTHSLKHNLQTLRMYLSTVRKQALLYIAWEKLEYLAKFHIKFPYDSTIPLLRTHLGDVLVKVGKKCALSYLLSDFFLPITKDQNELKCISKGYLINKQWYIHEREYYSAG